MRRMPVLIGFALFLGVSLATSAAFAVTAYSPTGHLNVRSGPGFQYQVVGQVQANVQAQITRIVYVVR